MFNTFQYNTSVFNATPAFAATAPQNTVVYNSYWLQNTNIVVSSITSDNWHSISSDTYSSPFTDLWWELNYFFKDKIVTLNWYLKYDTAILLNDWIDSLKKKLWENNKDLDIKVNWAIRRAKASCVNLDSLFQRQNYNITFLSFSIQFRLVSEFSKELTLQTQSKTSKTASFSESVINNWTTKTNPVLNILVNSETDLTSIAFNIWDNTITVLDSYQAADVLVIDCQDKTVKVNSVAIDYTWTFPYLGTGENLYTLTLTATAKNFNSTISFYNNYL